MEVNKLKKEVSSSLQWMIKYVSFVQELIKSETSENLSRETQIKTHYKSLDDLMNDLSFYIELYAESCMSSYLRNNKEKKTIPIFHNGITGIGKETLLFTTNLEFIRYDGNDIEEVKAYIAFYKEKLIQTTKTFIYK